MMQKGENRPLYTKENNHRPDTLEKLLTLCAHRYGDKLALCDPPDRNRLEGRSDHPRLRQYTFAQLDNVVERLTSRLLSLGLQAGDYVAVQLPNFVDTPIVVLALMRARLIPCLLPLSWPQEKIARSFERLKPKALISCGQLAGVNHSLIMRDLAFANLHIRFVLATGYDIAEGVSDISALFEQDLNDDSGYADDRDETCDQTAETGLNDLALVSYVDAVTPVPHTSGQILATGLLHVLTPDLGGDDKMLSAYPLSSIPGLAAHFYPWLMAGNTLYLHQPFDLGVLRQQLLEHRFDYFAAPDQLVGKILRENLPLPHKLAIVRRDNHIPENNQQLADKSEIFDLWNFAGLGSLPVRHDGDITAGLFPHGRVCLPPSSGQELCLAAATIRNDRLHIKGRIFPSKASANMSLEWFSLKQRFNGDWLDTGLPAFSGPDNSIQIGAKLQIPKQHKAAS